VGGARTLGGLPLSLANSARGRRSDRKSVASPLQRWPTMERPWTDWPDAWVWIGGIVLIAGGSALAEGIRRLRIALRSSEPDPGRALGVILSARIAILALAICGIGAGLVAELGWLWKVSLVILGEESLEGAVHVAALREGARRAEGPPGADSVCHSQG
jgi:hypothetical protein